MNTDKIIEDIVNHRNGRLTMEYSQHLADITYLTAEIVNYFSVAQRKLWLQDPHLAVNVITRYLDQIVADEPTIIALLQRLSTRSSGQQKINNVATVSVNSQGNKNRIITAGGDINCNTHGGLDWLVGFNDPAAIINNKPKQEKLKTKILLLCGNPSGHLLTFDRDVAEIQQAINQGDAVNLTEMAQRWAVTLDLMIQTIIQIQPNIIHFTGHGSVDGIVLQDEKGQPHYISGQHLGALFKPFNNTLKCVVLHSCFSLAQAEPIKQHVDYVIAVKGRVKNSAAKAFCRQFYRGVGIGMAIEQAFDIAISALKIQQIAIAEDEWPILLTHKGEGHGS